MKTAITLGIGSLLLLSAFTANTRTVAESRAAFDAEVAGDVTTRLAGDARFGVAGGEVGIPAVFTISLGAHSENGSVLFTRRSGERLVPGTYRISDRADGTDDLRALVMTGSATRPTGVFQGHSGTVVITSASEREIRGYFTVDGVGFLAEAPELENRPVKVSGSFTAAR